MTEEQAIAYVTLNAQTGAFPCIATEDVAAIVQRNVRATVWAPETAYNIGDRIQPTARNGHFYEAAAAGTSDTVEPTWSTRQNAIRHEFASDLIWQECALDVDGNLFNLRNAVHEAWVLKASMAAKEFDISIDQQKWNRSQVYDHCLEMAGKFQPFD
jgi:hypothetical protein